MACSIADVWNNFQRIECDWWVSMIRKSPEIVNELQDNGLKPEAMMINGEILFCLLGLKPIVIASEIPEQWRSDFMEGVITRSGIDGIASATFHMEVRRLDNIRSPCLDLSGSWVFMNVIHPLYSQATSLCYWIILFRWIVSLSAMLLKWHMCNRNPVRY
uniref:Uncharacterized protein n=1 Tax=Spongospora subterranea TaxID=70186 RepID=A0A0H5QR13_9EUKA|eukprot:CRZ04463.1 hypothetical protein [Spongospora subterranea]